ncbi:hypothetical protein JZU68_00150, partial [bacterium]|nr:hypothetical protein [bacterium]
MSTKTLRKRIALVAVASLGFGLVSTVPALAAAATASASSPLASTATYTSSLGTVTFGNITTTTADTFAVQVLTGPTGGVLTVVEIGTAVGTASTPTNHTVGAAVSDFTRSATATGGASALVVTGRFSLPGTYTVKWGDTTTTTGTYVVASNAATNASVTSLTITKPTAVVVGASASFGIAVNNATTISVGTADTYAIRAKITSAPAGGLSAFTGAFVTVTGWANGTGTVGASGANLLSATATASQAAGADSIGTLSFTPAKAGTYAIAFYHDANLNGLMEDNEVYQTSSITVGSTVSGLPNFGIATSATIGATSTLDGINVSSVGVSKVSVSGRVGVPVSFAPTYLLKANLRTGSGAASTTANLNTAAANLVYSVAGPTGTAVSLYEDSTAVTADAGQQYVGHASATLVTDDIVATGASETTPTIGAAAYFIPAAAGVYTITVYHDGGAGDSLISTGEAVYTTTVTVAADAQPTITFTQYGSTSEYAAGDTKWGKLVKISLRSGTIPANLAANESLTLTGLTGTVFDAKSSVDAYGVQTMVEGGNGVSVVLTSANFNGAGDAYVNVGSSVYGVDTISAVISGGTANGATGSFSFTSVWNNSTGKTYTVTEATDYEVFVVDSQGRLFYSLHEEANAAGTYSFYPLVPESAGSFYVLLKTANSTLVKPVIRSGNLH